MRLLTVLAKFGGVYTALLSSNSSSILWEISPNSWYITIPYEMDPHGCHMALE
jgi:hypothetical protein